MASVTVSQKGWVVIPAELRRKYQLTSGSQVIVVDYGGVLSLVPQFEQPIKKVKGLLKGDTSLTQALIDEHTRERTHA
ncbi:MAG: AbrB/MazE/SpoVT family DNA-binding domain-containing protein [bacterium]|nr:AbrB/MazE/SpoVT family DNA-binding domain-containing protein [bacterium]